MKSLVTFFTITLLLFSNNIGSSQQERGYAFSGYGEVWRDTPGECVRSPYRQKAAPECEPAQPAAAPIEPAPVVTGKPEPAMVTMERVVNFDFDRSEIRSDAKTTLDVLIDDIEMHQAHRIEIDGHTCFIGTEEYNQGLSERRADEVRRYLMAHGVDGKLITTRGHGETQPVYGNQSQETRCLNRRAEVKVFAIPIE